jgi:CubicO group peptidase (beta-lactamase class C family)
VKSDTSRLKRIGAIAQKHVSAGQFSSVEWSVEHQGRPLSRGAVGQADALNAQPLPDRPLYRIYSMTKPIVSVLALQMIEDGMLGLAHPVSLYLPEAARLAVQVDGGTEPLHKPVTIEQLLTHRAGFSYDFLPDCPVAPQYGNAQLAEDGSRTLEEMVNAILACPLAAQPGAQWRYSVSIDVLARVLEVASGQSLQQLLATRLFEPCGMVDTSFTVADDQQHRLMPMFGQKKLGEPMTVVTDPQRLYAMNVDAAYPVNSDAFVRGGIGLYSTTDDFQRFLPVLMDGKTPSGEAVLSAPMVDMMWRNRIPTSQRPLAVGVNPLPGYGWNLFGRVMTDTGQALSLSAQGEGGWAGAAGTYFWVDRERRFAGVVMTQYLGATVPIGDIIRSTSYAALV